MRGSAVEMEYRVTAWDQGKGQKLKKGYDSVPGGLGHASFILFLLSVSRYCLFSLFGLM